MKICMLATSFPRTHQDFVGQWVFGLARALVAQGARVVVISPHDHDTEGHEILDGVEIRRFSYWFPKRAHGLCYGAGIPTNIRNRKWLIFQFPALEAAFLVAAMRYGHDADIFNAHWTFSALPSVLVSKALGKPLVTHAYSAEYVSSLLHPVNRFINCNSQAVISISNFTHSVVEKVAPIRSHYVVGLGVNPEKIAPDDFNVMAFRSRIGVKSDEKMIFAVGRLVERKGYHILIEAIAKLVNQGTKVKFLLAGQGPEREKLQAQILASDIGDRAYLLGFIPDEMLRFYLRASDVLVMPSIVDHTGDTEGLGLPTIEAMANKTPVIASRIGGITDIVYDGETGLLVPPDDPDALAAAISRLFHDSLLQKQIISGGHKLFETTFSWETIAQRTLTIFDDAIRLKAVGS